MQAQGVVALHGQSHNTLPASSHAVSDGQAIMDSEEFTITIQKARLDINPEFSANTYRVKVGKGQAKLILVQKFPPMGNHSSLQLQRGGSVFSADVNVGYRAKVSPCPKCWSNLRCQWRTNHLNPPQYGQTCILRVVHGLVPFLSSRPLVTLGALWAWLTYLL